MAGRARVIAALIKLRIAVNECPSRRALRLAQTRQRNIRLWRSMPNANRPTAIVVMMSKKHRIA
jgi:hypothetical protein